MKNINIYTHSKTVNVIDLQIGDVVKFKQRNGKIVDKKVFKITDNTVWVKHGKSDWGLSYSILLDLNPDVKAYKETSSDFKIVHQKGVDGKDYFQVIYSFSKFVAKDRPFSLCYISDKEFWSNWTEWGLSCLPNGKEIDFKIEGNVITELCFTT